MIAYGVELSDKVGGFTILALSIVGIIVMSRTKKEDNHE